MVVVADIILSDSLPPHRINVFSTVLSVCLSPESATHLSLRLIFLSLVPLFFPWSFAIALLQTLGLRKSWVLRSRFPRPSCSP